MNYGLTNRERDVLALLVEGRSNREIAQRLGLSAKTVTKYLGHVYQKLGVTNRAQAAIVAVDAGEPELDADGISPRWATNPQDTDVRCAQCYGVKERLRRGLLSAHYRAPATRRGTDRCATTP